MTLGSQTARRSDGWGWFFVWALLGSAAALGTVSLGPLLLLPTALVAVFVWRRPQARRSAFGLLTGAGTLLLYVALGATRRSGNDLLAYGDGLRMRPASESAALARARDRPRCRWLRRARSSDLRRLACASAPE
jgi:hypothetical protein